MQHRLYCMHVKSQLWMACPCQEIAEALEGSPAPWDWVATAVFRISITTAIFTTRAIWPTLTALESWLRAQDKQFNTSLTILRVLQMRFFLRMCFTAMLISTKIGLYGMFPRHRDITPYSELHHDGSKSPKPHPHSRACGVTLAAPTTRRVAVHLHTGDLHCRSILGIS